MRRGERRTVAAAAARVALAAGLAALPAGCQWGSKEPALQGYVEGTYVNVAAEEAGRIAARPVQRGAHIEAGALLFELTKDEQEATLAEAVARVAQAEAQVAQARSSFDAADKDYKRAENLRATNVVSQAGFDAAKAKRDVADGQLSEAERNLAALEAARDLAQVHLTRRAVTAPATGTIEETYFEPGEFVAAAQPVLSLLPADGRKIRFYVPEPRLNEIKLGDRVAVSCDGCAAGLEGEVTFIATQAEFTPPVIYSIGNREKLVFRVEARPIDGASALAVGLPVEVRKSANRDSQGG